MMMTDTIVYVRKGKKKLLLFLKEKIKLYITSQNTKRPAYEKKRVNGKRVTRKNEPTVGALVSRLL